jgi:hypothetical protein
VTLPDNMPPEEKLGCLTTIKAPAPIIVGGVGGSGTRLIMALLEGLGVQLGANLNGPKDALDFVGLYDEFIPLVLERKLLDSQDYQRFVSAYLDCIERYLQCMKNPTRWAFKNPRSIYLWPIFKRVLPSTRFIHVVRDGVLMSNSSNMNQFNLYAKFFLTNNDINTLPFREQTLIFWARAMKSFQEFTVPNEMDVLSLRFEDLTRDTEVALRRLAVFLGIASVDVKEVLKNVQIQQTRARDSYKFLFNENLREEVNENLVEWDYLPC